MKPFLLLVDLERQVYLALFGLLALLLSACNPVPFPTPDRKAPTRTASPPSTESTATHCPFRLVPMPTGEKESRVMVKATPPARARPGASIVIELSEGYGLIGNYARVCGEDQVVGYIFADELPDFKFERTVQVYLDNRLWSESQCAKDCRIELAIPEELSPGSHRIRVDFPSHVTDPTFEIEVVD